MYGILKLPVEKKKIPEQQGKINKLYYNLLFICMIIDIGVYTNR